MEVPRERKGISKPPLTQSYPIMKNFSPVAARFRRYQWLMLLVTTFCYLFYYTGRQSWGFVIQSLENDLGLDKVQMGWIAGAMLAAYGIGQFVNGNLGDQFGGRRLLCLGAITSTVLVWVTSFSNSFVTLLIFWTLNGYAQSLGWAPGGKIITNWWGSRERAKAFGVYMTGAAFSSVLIFALCILILQLGLSWRWVFRLPVLLLLLSGIACYFIIRDTPEELGLNSPDEEAKKDKGGEFATTVETTSEERAIDRYLAALGNWRFMTACISIGFESMARYGLLIWVPVYYLGKGWEENPSTAWISLALPIGMAFGAIFGGQLSDRFFHSKRRAPIVLLMLAAAFVSLALYFVPKEQQTLAIGLLFLSGFLVYAPQSAFWALCPDLLGVKRAGTGIGVMDAIAYLFAAAQGPIFGIVISRWGEPAIFVATAIVCMLCVLTILPVKK